MIQMENIMSWGQQKIEIFCYSLIRETNNKIIRKVNKDMAIAQEQVVASFEQISYSSVVARRPKFSLTILWL